MGRFVIIKRSSTDYQFNLLAKNGEIILSGNCYPTNSACRNAIESARAHAAYDDNYTCHSIKGNNYYFTLKAINAEVVGISNIYESAAERDIGIELVRDNVIGAFVDDRS